MKPLRHLLAALLLAAPCALTAGALDDGLKAFNAKDYGRAFALWKPLAEQGEARAQFNLGLLYANGWGISRDYREAMEWYRRAAAQGSSDAQFNLGQLYAEGKATFRSDPEAVKWWELAAAQGHVRAQYNLGVMYAYGMGCKQDTGTALRLWEQAARKQDKDAATALATAHEQGLFGLKKDPQQAAQWRPAGSAR